MLKERASSGAISELDLPEVLVARRKMAASAQTTQAELYTVQRLIQDLRSNEAASERRYRQAKEQLNLCEGLLNHIIQLIAAERQRYVDAIANNEVELEPQPTRDQSASQNGHVRPDGPHTLPVGAAETAPN